MRHLLGRLVHAEIVLALLLLGACSEDGGAPAVVVGGGGDGGDPPADMDGGPIPDAGPDAGPVIEAGADAATCEGVACGVGLACVVAGGQAMCEGSCDGVTCASDRQCEVLAGVGTCVALCDPACGLGQRCELTDDGTGECIDNTCDELDCGPTEACEAAADGTGFVCADNTCSDDLECEAQQHCSEQGVCTADACTPGARRCDGQDVLECTPNGSGEIVRVSCLGAGEFDSICTEGGCGCRGDWDCPPNTVCAVGRCEGTGREATCFVPPLPFEDVLPEPEPGFPWGGDDGDGYNGNDAQYLGDVPSRWAWGSPFPEHAQVSSAPVVANLDDDNGDGLINELDYPEILFTSFCQRNYFDNGVLRAVHGGGDRPGTHLFAVCEDKLWQEGDPIFQPGTEDLADEATCGCNAGDLEPTGGLAVGDLDNDGVPEIVLLSDGNNDRLRIHNNTGVQLSESSIAAVAGSDPAVAIANVDATGFAEVVSGRAVYVLGRDVDDRLTVVHELVGAESSGVNNSQGASSCVADLDGDGRMEVIAGGTAYRVPESPAADCPADTSGLTGDARLYCDGQLDELWDHGAEGFCAVADVLGAPPQGVDPEVPPGPGAPLDGAPEVLLITAGRLLVLNGLTGAERLNVVLDDRDGGPPNVDDFDGDGFPEVATAFDTKYVVHDFQAPTDVDGACPAWDQVLDGDPASTDPINEGGGNVARTPAAISCATDADCGDPNVVCGSDTTCTCLHNGWASLTQDDSSRVTGSSVFDFNGDGKAEVVYNDECYFRIYEGPTGRVYQRLKSQSPTRIEYPVVADVDNDGNAEVVFSGSNARSEGCPDQGQGDYGNGIHVIGEPQDRWVSARRVWNQHSYHITNVLEGGGVPEREVDSWGAYNGRTYNTYRSNLPPLGNVAPDLVVSGVQVSSPDVACGEPLSDTIRITARIENRGDLRVGPGVVVAFLGDGMTLGTETLATSLEPGAELFVSFEYSAASAEALPEQVVVRVDAEGDPVFGSERECFEDNNEATAPVEPGEAIADLRVTVALLDGDCPDRTLRVQVFNDGAVDVESATVRVYAGNPAAGGEVLGDDLAVGPIPAGGATGSLDIDVRLDNRSATVFVVIDPDGEINECDAANNASSVAVECAVTLI